MKHLQLFESSNKSPKVDVWLAFSDGHDGSYNVYLCESKSKALDSLGLESDPESTYDDGAIKKFSIPLKEENGKWVLPKTIRIDID